MVVFTRWISQLDTFGSKISLMMQRQTSLKTFSGAVISLLVLVFFILQVETLLSRLIMQTDPSISNYEVHEIVLEPTNLVENRMPIAFNFIGMDGVTGYSNTIDPRAGKIKVLKRTKKHGQKDLVVPLAVERCSEKHFSSMMLNEQTDKRGIDIFLQALCVQPDVELNGLKSYDNSTNLQIQIKVCDSGQSQQEDVCMNSTELSAYFGKASI